MTERKHDNFDEFARDYDEVHAGTLDISGADRDYFSMYKIAEMAKHEDPSASLQMLDFGCGDGNSVKYMREFFPNASLFGTDVSEKSVEEAKEKKISNARFVPYDGEALPYDDNSMDVIFTSMVFHHISFDRHDALLDEIKRVLNPNGRFYIFEHNPLNPITRKIVRECEFDHDAVLLPHRYSQNLLQRGGFKQQSTNFTLFLPRHWVFKWALPLESFLSKVPLGAQYFVRATK